MLVRVRRRSLNGGNRGQPPGVCRNLACSLGESNPEMAGYGAFQKMSFPTKRFNPALTMVIRSGFFRRDSIDG
jgi:hypothetical protein